MSKTVAILLIAFNILIGSIFLIDRFGFPSFTFAPENNPDNVTVVSKKEPPKKLVEEVEEVDTKKMVGNVLSEPTQTKNPIKDLNSITSFAIYTSKVDPEIVAKSSYPMIIVNEADKNSKLFTSDDVVKMKSNGKVILADVSVTVAEKPRWYWKAEWNVKLPPFLGDKIDSGYYVSQWWHPDWWTITTKILDKTIEAGYDGIVLSSMDTYIDLGASKALRDKMYEYVIKISKYAKKENSSFLILVKNGELLGRNDEYLDSVDGIIKENLIYSKISNGNSGPKNLTVQISKQMNDLKLFEKAKKAVFIIEYVSGSHWKEAKSLLKSNGFIGYSSPRIPNMIRDNVF